MTAINLLEAMEGMDDVAVASAAQQLYGNAQPRRHITLRRLVSLAAAAALLLTLTFLTALAVSDDFREKVFSLFQPEATEIVPPITPPTDDSGMSVQPEKVIIGQDIQGTYLTLPETSHARDGAFFICTDEVQMNSGNHYDAYDIENGEFVKLQAQHFDQHYTILGNEFHMEFDWVDCGDQFNYTYVDSDVPWRTQNFAGPASATLFTFECTITLADGTVSSTSYPVLIDLYTGQLTDILAGTGAEQIPNIYKAALSQDRRHMVLVQWDGRDTWLYYVDLETKQLYSLDVLSGTHVTACALTDHTITCWSLNKEAQNKLGTYDIWAFDLDSLERVDLYQGLPATAATDYDTLEFAPSCEEVYEGLQFLGGFSLTSYWGNHYPGSKFALEVDKERNVFVIDLATGQRSRIEGFLWPELDFNRISCIPSADGNRLLIYTNAEDYSIDSIGVIDFENETFYRFLRDNTNGIPEQAYWFDGNSVMVLSSDVDGIKYCCLYEFPE